MCVKISINWFPIKHSVSIPNLLINVLLLGQNVHNESNTWPDFHNNI